MVGRQVGQVKALIKWWGKALGMGIGANLVVMVHENSTSLTNIVTLFLNILVGKTILGEVGSRHSLCGFQAIGG